jgi:hypothetical protein
MIGGTAKRLPCCVLSDKSVWPSSHTTSSSFTAPRGHRTPAVASVESAEETMTQKPDSLCSGGLDREIGGQSDAPLSASH